MPALTEPLPALRAGGPSRLALARGRMPDLPTQSSRDTAVQQLMRGIYAESSAPALRGRRGCYLRMLRLWGLVPFPITQEKVIALGAGLKAGGYRSAGSVLSQYSTDAARAGQVLSQPVARALTDATRSCARGLGPPIRALALEVPRFAELPTDPAPFCAGGPVGPRNMLIVGAWWLLREAEIAGVRAKHAQISPGAPPVASLILPASKSDPRALGVARTQACICGAGRPRADCPVHALWDQLLVLKRRYPDRHRRGAPTASLPLFPAEAGGAITKAACTACILEAAKRTHQPTSNADGTLRVSGHSLRASGAQHLSRLGTDLLSVQLLGRWGSNALLSYIREASVGPEAARARSRQLSINVRDLTTAAAAATLPPPSAPDFKEEVQTWFTEWFRAAGREHRASLVEEVTEAVARASSRRSRCASTSSSSSSSSSSTSPPPPAPAAEPEGELAEELGELLEEGLTARPAEEELGLAAVAPVLRESSCLVFVSHDKFERVHQVRAGPPLDPPTWRTLCSWRFGLSRHARLPKASDVRCDRCSSMGGSSWEGLQ